MCVMQNHTFSALMLGMALAGCAPSAPAPVSGPAARRVEIVSPREGEVVTGPDVVVILAAHDFTVVRAGDATPNSGHHHVFLDRDLSPAGAPIPTEAGRIVHLGNGAGEITLQGVPPGRHRLIAMVGDAGHVPLQPLLADTVRFTVR
jgi:hypothetical protein